MTGIDRMDTRINSQTDSRAFAYRGVCKVLSDLVLGDERPHISISKYCIRMSEIIKEELQILN